MPSCPCLSNRSISAPMSRFASTRLYKPSAETTRSTQVLDTATAHPPQVPTTKMMICAQPTSAGPSAPRTTRSPSAPAYSCASSYAYPESRDAIFPFPGPAPTLHQRELYLRALEQEREEILAAAYSTKRSNSSPSASVSPFAEAYGRPDYDVDEDDSDSDDDEMRPRFDDRGRQLNFRETVRQRQARLEYLRRQDFARRIAHRGLEDSRASAYAIKRLPPPRARPIERVNAAIKIQRAYRLHKTVKGLSELTKRVYEAHETFLASSKENYDDAWKTHAEVLHELLRELGERTGVLAETQTTAKTDCHNLHPRVRAAARTAMEALRSELALLDRAQISRHYSLSSSTSSISSKSSSSSDSEEDDYFDDEEYDSDGDEDDYASYTYTPPQAVSTELYVVDEEDEEEDDYVPQPQPRLWSNAMQLYSINSRTKHQRSRHAPLSSPTSSPVPVILSLVRSPVSRSPSLASIPEERDEDFLTA
ncbi:hypothetical protein ACEPAG_9671 [Sanghuangporus baumii]